jgi:hypothetical protein
MPPRESEVATGECRLIELDGGRAGPVDRGKTTDLLKVCKSLPAKHFCVVGGIRGV